jgi:diamine N-acetyltransferase
MLARTACRSLNKGVAPLTKTCTIKFHPATADDIPVIQGLSARIWRDHYPGIITHGQIDYMLGKMYAATVINDEIQSKGYRYVIAMDGATPIGYMAYYHEERTGAVMISKLYLLPSLHGQGIGKQMLAHVKDKALQMSAQKLYLFVNKNNVKAIAAYEKFGFVKTGAIITDIGGGFVMDDFRMELAL